MMLYNYVYMHITIKVNPMRVNNSCMYAFDLIKSKLNWMNIIQEASKINRNKREIKEEGKLNNFIQNYEK